MATITVARSGSWDDTSHITGPWPGASTPTTLPTSADAVILNAAYTLTLKGAGMACLSLTQSAGTIAVDATANWDITFGNATGDTANLAVSGGTCTIDMSGAAAYNGTVYLNKGANTAGLGIQSSGTCNVTLKGATRKRWTRLNGGISAGATSATVDDATGWKVGDAVMFGTTQPYNATPRLDAVTLTSVDTGTGVIGWSGGITYDHADNCYTGNFSSNLTIRPYGTNLSYVALDNSGTRVVQDVALTGLAGAVFAKYGLSLNNGNTTVANVSNNAFYSTHASNINLFFLRFLGAAVTRDDNIFYCTTGNVYSGQSTNVITGDWNRAIIFRSSGNGLTNVQAGETFFDCVTLSTSYAFPATSYGTEYVRCSALACANAFYSTSGGGTYGSYTDCDIGTEFGAYNGTVVNINGASRTITNGCTFQTSGTFASGIPSATKPQFAGADLINKNGDVTLQESYYSHCTIKRNNTTHYRSPSSVSVAPLLTATDSQRTVSVPCPNGSSVTVVGYVQKSHATNVSATVAITGLGSSVTPFTKANDTNWEQYTLTATNSSGTDGNFTLTYTANSSSGTTNVVYFDGVPDAPFITVARHYGKLFPQTTPNAVANDAVVANETTALTYSTKFSVTGGAAQSDVALAADATFQQLYDYTQAWAVTTANQSYAVPCASPLAGILIAAGDVATTGFSLNGSGSLAMGAHTLTGSIPFSYTYTGGTFSQLTSTPAFSNGTLTIGAEATYIFSASSLIIELTPSAAGVTYDFTGGTFSGTIYLKNLTAHAINVSVASSSFFDLTANAGGTITLIAPTLNQKVILTGLTTTCRIQLYDTDLGVQLYNGEPGASSFTWTDPAIAASPRPIRMRRTDYLGSTAAVMYEGNIGTCGVVDGEETIRFNNEFEMDANYATQVAALGYNGASITDIEIDDSTDTVKFNFLAGGDYDARRIYMYMVYWLDTEAGIADDFVFCSPLDPVNLPMTGVLFENVTSPQEIITFINAYVYDATTGRAKDLIVGDGINFAPDHVVQVIATVGGVNIITGDIGDVPTAAEIAAEVAANPETVTVSTLLALQQE